MVSLRSPFATNAVNEKNNVQHVERLEGSGTGGMNGKDLEGSAAALPASYGDVDEETAKYLDPNIVIDEETNRTIKKMVCVAAWRVGRVTY